MSETKAEPAATASETNNSSAPVITAPATKIKDPKRVARGKKLAEISKAAKERKARERFEAESASQHQQGFGFSEPNFGFIFGFVGMIVGVASLYYNYLKTQPTTTAPTPTATTTTTTKLESL